MGKNLMNDMNVCNHNHYFKEESEERHRKICTANWVNHEILKYAQRKEY